MRINVATLGSERYHAEARATFTSLAEDDGIGRHQLEDDPRKADAILFVDLQQHPEDPLLKQLPNHPLVRRYPQKTFVYDERDFPVYSFPGIYVGAPAGWAHRLPVSGGPYPSLLNPVPPTSREPDLLFSFRGAVTHPTRSQLLRLAHPRAIVEESESPFVGHGKYALGGASSTRYGDLIQSSKFVLCPRGHGPSSFRLYETLEAHRVPVVISDDWLPPPRIDWSQCVIRISEDHVTQVSDILESLEPRWQQLVVGGDVARTEFSRSRLWNHYGDSLAALAGVNRTPLHHVIGWPRRMRVRARLLHAQLNQGRRNLADPPAPGATREP